jgi:hypothetical protein
MSLLELRRRGLGSARTGIVGVSGSVFLQIMCNRCNCARSMHAVSQSAFGNIPAACASLSKKKPCNAGRERCTTLRKPNKWAPNGKIAPSPARSFQMALDGNLCSVTQRRTSSSRPAQQIAGSHGPARRGSLGRSRACPLRLPEINQPCSPRADGACSSGQAPSVPLRRRDANRDERHPLLPSAHPSGGLRTGARTP